MLSASTEAEMQERLNADKQDECRVQVQRNTNQIDTSKGSKRVRPDTPLLFLSKTKMREKKEHAACFHYRLQVHGSLWRV